MVGEADCCRELKSPRGMERGIRRLNAARFKRRYARQGHRDSRGSAAGGSSRLVVGGKEDERAAVLFTHMNCNRERRGRPLHST